MAAHGSGVESTSRSRSCQDAVSRASSGHRRQQPAGAPLAVPGLAGQTREQAGRVLAGDPAPLAGDAQRVLGDGESQ
jgi:hypothetical protein